MRISYAIIRNENHKMGAVPLLERHNERRNKKYSNKDIDPSHTCANYHLKQPKAGSYEQEFYRIKDEYGLKGNLRLTGKKQSTILCEFVITSDKVFFDRLGAERTKQFFFDAYRFGTHKVGGEQFVVSAVVHMDEKTPHMHVAFIPTVMGKDRRGSPCRRVNASEFWKGRDSYSRLQDEYHAWITSCGYELERGVKGSTAEHLSVEEYKIKKTAEQLAALQGQVEEVKAVDEIPSKSLPFNMVSVKREDFNDLLAAAKGYITAKAAEVENEQLSAENEQLHVENQRLKDLNNAANAKYAQLDHDFAEFYDSVADEVALRDENARLDAENGRLCEQLHTARTELNDVKTENAALRTKESEQEQQIVSFKAELSNLQRLYAVLQERVEKIMRFVEQHKLTKALQEFLGSGKKKKDVLR